MSHYQLQPKGYDFAQRWFQALFGNTLSAGNNARHVTHVSRGFIIKDGDRDSIIALHNAVNPFEYEPTPTSTVMIGVYGYEATERRFHRAYWLAANQLGMKDLLNRGISDDKPHDGVEIMG